MVVIRLETPEDAAAVRRLNEDAFGGTDEADIVDKLRSRQASTLSLVAADTDKIVGHILFSPVTIESEGTGFEAIALAPMAVLTAYQKSGIGSQLVRVGLEECQRLGHEIVVVLGHPEYYPRFGFIPARPEGIDCEFEAPDEVWMILELHEGALAGRKGTVKFQPEFSGK
ncbi:GNAT family N-acetyltransferase [Chloroflexota bacterium]